jgi:hypothetical protein
MWGGPVTLSAATRSTTFSQVNFIQGTAEQTPFVNERFDGVAACLCCMNCHPDRASRQRIHTHHPAVGCGHLRTSASN